jgi:hypothetical protein
MKASQPEHTYSDPRNHLSVPRRSDSAEMASRYCISICDNEKCVPYGGRRELKPENGAGGGMMRVSIGFVLNVEDTVDRREGRGID